MITVAICDDNEQERNQIEQTIESYIFKGATKMRIYKYNSGESFCEQLENIKFDIIFLDIYMEEMTGIEVAKHVREKNKEALIIFTTSSSDHALEAYGFRAFHYLLKPIGQLEIEKILQDALQHIQYHKGVDYIISTPEGVRKIQLDDVYYIESSVRKTIIHFEDENCVCDHNINTLESKLSYYGFVRCHRSFIVNLNQVKVLRTNEIELKNGETVFLSKYKQKDVKKQLVDYCGGRM